MSIILHITHLQEWETAVFSGYYSPSSLNSDGFIHCSTIEQTVETANTFFENQQDLILLCIDENKTEAEVKYEAPASGTNQDQRKDSMFPHLYGPLNVSAVVRVIEFVPKTDGKFELPEEISQLAQLFLLI